MYFHILLGQWEGVILEIQYGLLRVFSPVSPKKSRQGGKIFIFKLYPSKLIPYFLFNKNLNHPPKIQILTNVKTSPPQESIKIDDDVFVQIKKCILRVFLVLAALGLLLFITTLLSIKLCFCCAFLIPLNACLL